VVIAIPKINSFHYSDVFPMLVGPDSVFPNIDPDKPPCTIVLDCPNDLPVPKETTEIVGEDVMIFIG
jgi:hypothetical protein